MTIDLSKNEHQKLDEDDELPAINYKASQTDSWDDRPLVKRKTAWIVLVFGLGIILKGRRKNSVKYEFGNFKRV